MARVATKIAVVGLKGGGGKSTLSTNIACELVRRGRRVLVIDTDMIQHSCVHWASRAGQLEVDGPPVSLIDPAALRRDLPKLSSGYHYVVIDTPGRLDAETRTALLLADIVVIPVAAGPTDAWAIRETLLTVKSAMELRPELIVGVVFSKWDGTGVAKVLESAVEAAVRSEDMPVMKTRIFNRVAYRAAMMNGRGAVSWEPDGEASLEIRALVKEMRLLLQARRAPK